MEEEMIHKKLQSVFYSPSKLSSNTHINGLQTGHAIGLGNPILQFKSVTPFRLVHKINVRILINSAPYDREFHLNKNPIRHGTRLGSHGTLTDLLLSGGVWQLVGRVRGVYGSLDSESSWVQILVAPDPPSPIFLSFIC